MRAHRLETDFIRGKRRAWAQDENGFTLLEILIALAISTVVIMAIYSVYMGHLKSANAQEKIVAMRQNWRAGQFVIGRDLMKAGYSRKIKPANKPGFTRASKSALTFTYVGGATGNLVSVAYDLKNNVIVRTIAGAESPVAEDIEALEFIYHMKDGSTTWSATTQAERDDIRSVRVTILARTATSVRDYPNSDTYAVPFPDGQTENTINCPSDGLYRQLVTGFYYCRNMGAN